MKADEAAIRTAWAKDLGKLSPLGYRYYPKGRWTHHAIALRLRLHHLCDHDECEDRSR